MFLHFYVESLPPSLSGAGMKLHEKILTHYLSCTSPVDKEGYLYKKV